MRIRWLLTGSLGLASVANQAAAQIPPNPGPAPNEGTIIPYVIGVVLVLAVGFGALKSSKRTHQD